MKNNPLTWDEHDALGAELQAMYERLTTISVMLGSRYGATSKVEKKADNARAKLSDLRSALDSLLFEEFAEKDTQVLSSVYYRGGSTKHE